jgi:mono/diheme cytochrome c family protein
MRTRRLSATTVSAVLAAALSACGGGSSSLPKNAGPGERAYFKAGCGGCHTFAPANSTGTVGPKLDGLGTDAATVETIVRDGKGGMPGFKDQLSEAEIRAVSRYVTSAGK